MVELKRWVEPRKLGAEPRRGPEAMEGSVELLLRVGVVIVTLRWVKPRQVSTPDSTQSVVVEEALVRLIDSFGW